MEENFGMEWNMEENFSMEWNMEENFSMEWNGRFLVWNGRKLPVWNIEKSSSMPCPDATLYLGRVEWADFFEGHLRSYFFIYKK